MMVYVSGAMIARFHGFLPLGNVQCRHQCNRSIGGRIYRLEQQLTRRKGQSLVCRLSYDRKIFKSKLVPSQSMLSKVENEHTFEFSFYLHLLHIHVN